MQYSPCGLVFRRDDLSKTIVFSLLHQVQKKLKLCCREGFSKKSSFFMNLLFRSNVTFFDQFVSYFFRVIQLSIFTVSIITVRKVLLFFTSKHQIYKVLITFVFMKEFRNINQKNKIFKKKCYGQIDTSIIKHTKFSYVGNSFLCDTVLWHFDYFLDGIVCCSEFFF